MIPNSRYWRVRFLTNNGGPNLGVATIDFCGREDGPGYATGGTAIASHGDASGAFTGGTPWYVEFSPGNTWIGYIFPNIIAPSWISLSSGGPDAPLTCVVEASNDGRVWYAIDGEIVFNFPLEPV